MPNFDKNWQKWGYFFIFSFTFAWNWPKLTKNFSYEGQKIWFRVNIGWVRAKFGRVRAKFGWVRAKFRAELGAKFPKKTLLKCVKLRIALVKRVYCRRQRNLKRIMKLDSDCGPTTEPQDMIGLPTGRDWLGEEAEIRKNPDFKTQLSQDQENCHFWQLWLELA